MNFQPLNSNLKQTLKSRIQCTLNVNIGVVFLFVFCLLGSSVEAAGDFRSAVQDYSKAKSKFKKVPFKQRADFVKKELEPKLFEIAKDQSREALQFITKEFNSGGADISGAAVKSLLHLKDDKALGVLLGGFSKRSPKLREDILDQMKKSKRDLEAAVPHLLIALRTEKDSKIQVKIPPILAKVDTLVSAKGMIDSLAKTRGKPADVESFMDSIKSALKKTKSKDVKEWLARDAFSKARGSQLPVLIYLAGELKLKSARPEIVELLDNRKESISSAALIAILKLGIGDQLSKIEDALIKGGSKKSIEFKIEALDALAATGTDEALEIVAKVAKEGDLESKTIAVGSLGRLKKSDTALEALLVAIKDPAVEVRNAALRSLRGFRKKEMISALINRIKEEKEEKLRIDALKILIVSTGKNMGLEHLDWNKWWDLAESKFEFPKLDKKGTSVKAYGLDYFGIEISSNRIAFLIDASSSMRQMVTVKKRKEKPKEKDKPKKGSTGRVPPKDSEKDGKGSLKPGKAMKLDVLKHEMIRVLRGLPASANINIMYFHTTFQAWKKKLQPMNASGRKQAIDFIRKLQNGTGTNVYDTLEAALKDRRVDTIFLLTDGNPTRGKLTDKNAILKKIQVLNRVRGATINCIAFGEKSELLKELAAQNGGVYRFVDEY